MVIGVPKEVKDREARVGLVPAGVCALKRAGHVVLVEAGAGRESFLEDREYRESGAVLLDSPADVWSQADIVVKVKEPQPGEYQHFRAGQTLFTYLHLAALPQLTQALVDARVTAIAYETVQHADGSLPLLEPMSEVAGRLASQLGAEYLEKHRGGRGVLLGGVSRVPPAGVVIIGGGMVGNSAAGVALGMGARVTILDKNLRRLRGVGQPISGPGLRQ